ncbi:MAG: ATP-binding protein [Alicyclobacillaceae bacterium]|nr:ATP-binding protein [Alicyclobacillaceae bacterium]
MQHIRELLPVASRSGATSPSIAQLRGRIPELNAWNVPDSVVERHRLMLAEFIRQQEICEHCTGFPSCPKEGDMKGFIQRLERYGSSLTVSVMRCKPFEDDQRRLRVARYAAISGVMPQDTQYRFANFPLEQRRKYPRLLAFAERFADTFEAGQTGPGLYLFGPPGVGKTHLMLAVYNRLSERGVPCLFVRSDSVFDRMRHILADGGDLEPLLDAYANAPWLGIDEFGQERANDFTLEKLFRILNHRFHAQLPTWFTSNFAPPYLYRKDGADLTETVAPLRSRIMQMAKLARMEGADFRQRHLESLT